MSRAKAAAMSAIIVSIFTAHALLFSLYGRVDDDHEERLSVVVDSGGRNLPLPPVPPHQHNRLTRLTSALSSLPFMASQAIVDDSDSDYDFSVLLVSYHKTGHDLAMDLVDYIKYEFPASGLKLTEFGNKSPVRRRRHPPKTPCSRIQLQSGAVSVQHAPDLFCTPEEMAHMLLEGGTGHAGAADRGVKIVHLIRNPFEMAVSNYNYHAQVPTPEPWVKFQNPCEIQYAEDAITESYADMVLPALSKMKYEALNVTFGAPLVTPAEFDAIANDCLSLFRTREELKRASFLDHLMNYDAPEGLRLATAEMTIQGHDNGGDVLRMANNIIKFKQAQVNVQNSPEYWEAKKGLQVYTMSMDDFIAQPAVSAYKFFDFVFDQTTDVSQMQKEAVAQRYKQYYLQKMKSSRHITNGKLDANSEQLKKYLRHDAVFGPPLSKIELLVETVVEDSRRESYPLVP